MGRRSGSPIPPTSYEEKFGIWAVLKFDFPKTFVDERKKRSISSWLTNQWSRVTETTGTKEFLTGATELLFGIGLSHVSVVDVGDYESYLEKESGFNRNLDEAFSTASKRSKTDAEEVWILARGLTNDFEFEQDLTYRPSHKPQTPPLVLEILACPAEWNTKSKEFLSGIFQDKAKLSIEEDHYRLKINEYLKKSSDWVISTMKGVRLLDSEVRFNLSSSNPSAFEQSL
ncbi:MAG TPA: hypothetical protein VGR53_11145 [Nitrososphaerales archaeon]|nr:hypothetical protein [Nitrososphaerales archaeon]